MRTKMLFLVAVVGLLAGPAWQSSTLAQAGDRALVERYLQEMQARGYTIVDITDDYVTGTFPGTSFFNVWFRQWPVAILPPPKLSASNIFFVQNGEVFYLTSEQEMEIFFYLSVAPVTKEEEAKNVCSAWLRLSAEFSQDGYYEFSPPEVDYMPLELGGLAFGQVTVRRGGAGTLDAYLEFDGDGQLVGISEDRQFRRGIRPVCQATKLLDADPIVRLMAEQALLVLGRSAKSYLDEQRAKATPELQKAIDRIWKQIVEEGR